jgi:galactonate dehydratase
MKVVKVEDLHCDAGWRVNSFLKITTDEGIVGWSEYMEGYGAQGLTGVILKLAERHLIGQDPRPVERHSAHLYAATRQAAGGVNQMAIAAIENALVDIKAKALGVPVYEMLGGPATACSSIGRIAAPTAPAMPNGSRNWLGSIRCARSTTS